MTSLWELYKRRSTTARTVVNSGISGPIGYRPEQTFERAWQNRRSAGKMKWPRRARTRRGRATFDHYAWKAATPMFQHSPAADNSLSPARAKYPLAAIPTNYRGCRFRSRLEARWAVFFDHLDIGWRYEPQGYTIGGRAYLPDFLLECGTWVEVKGHEDALDYGLLRTAAIALPKMPATDERGPRLLILGGHPVRPDVPLPGDYGWLGIDLDGRGDELLFGTYGFGRWNRHQRPWHFGERTGDGPWLRPVFEEWEADTTEAYEAANSARFEHGESGAR